MGCAIARAGKNSFWWRGVIVDAIEFVNQKEKTKEFKFFSVTIVK